MRETTKNREGGLDFSPVLWVDSVDLVRSTWKMVVHVPSDVGCLWVD